MIFKSASLRGSHYCLISKIIQWLQKEIVIKDLRSARHATSTTFFLLCSRPTDSKENREIISNKILLIQLSHLILKNHFNEQGFRSSLKFLNLITFLPTKFPTDLYCSSICILPLFENTILENFTSKDSQWLAIINPLFLHIFPQVPTWLISQILRLAATHMSFSSVAQSCPTLCDPMNRSTPGLPVHHQLLEFTQTHVHWVSDAIQPSHPLSSPFPPIPPSIRVINTR